MTLKKSLPWLFLALIFCLAANVILTCTNYLKGDGYEYLLMTESLGNHHSPEARFADLESLQQKIKLQGHVSPIDEPIFSGYLEMLQGGKNSMGYFRAKDQQHYSYHFWLYSLVNVPALYLTNSFGVAPVHSFLITNLFIFLATALFLLNTRLLSARERFFITAFYIFSGTTYYLDWSHPEVFSASLLLVGLIQVIRNRALTGLVLLALASQQNPPIAFLTLAILGWQGLVALKNKRLGQIFVLAAISALLFWSPIFYLLHFGTPSLIVSSGAASNKLVSLDRLFSFFFDLNQGMLVAIPLVFLLGIVGSLNLAFNWKWIQQSQMRKEVLTAFLMLAFTLLIAIPVLTTGNWNSGQSILLRYAYWGAMPLGLAVMLLLNRFSTKSYSLLFLLFFIGQTCFLLSYRISGREDTMQMKALPSYFINNKPDWYNPVPAIFVKRTLADAAVAEADSVYYYVNQHRVITKLLYQAGKEQTLLPFCQDHSIAELKSQTSAVATEEHWFYLNNLGKLCHTQLLQGLYKFK